MSLLRKILEVKNTKNVEELEEQNENVEDCSTGKIHINSTENPTEGDDNIEDVNSDKFLDDLNEEKVYIHPLIKIRKVLRSSVYFCAVCSEGFFSEINLTKHSEKHKNDRSYQCEICEKKFSRMNNFNAHKRMHSNSSNPFTCKICGKIFTHAYKLKYHNNRVHNKSLKCNICDLNFATSRKLKKHMKIHIEYKYYNCEWCSQVYSDETTLNAHKNTHNEQNIETA